MLSRIFICLLISLAAMADVSAHEGIMFRSGPLDALHAEASREKKWVIVDFTASWCEPCRRMEATTFPDAELGRYVNDRFVAGQVDTDLPAGKAIAAQLGIKAYPTIIIFDERGREVRRITGYRSATGLLRELQPLENLQ